MRSSALNGSSKFCKNEKTVITFLSSGSRSSSSLANKEASELPEILSQSNKIWTGDGVLSRLKFSPNGKYIGSYGSEKSAQILNVNGKEGVHLVGHTGPVNSIDFSHSRGYSVLTCGTDKTVRLWDWKARVNKVTIGGDHGYDTSGLSSKLSIYRNKLSGHRVKYDKLRFGKDEVNKSSFYYLDQFILSGAGNALYVHSLEGIDSDYKEDIKITQIDTFVFPNAKNVLDFYASNSCFSHIALISCSDKSLKVFDLNYGKVCLNIPRAHSRPILSIARSEGALYKMEEEIGENEDHNLFGTYTLGDGVKIWDIRSVESCVQRCDWPGSDRGGRIASSIDMSPCSKYLIVGGEDGGVYVFDLRMTSSFCSRLVGGSSSSPITGVVFNTTTTSNIFATNLQGELFQFKNKGS
uniref:WD repeatcontaining protein 27like [Strongylocentrotus purpuratus] n=1 Tax=Lepeophtheirus salmonis TaxID=72036 RepID=A0A0K2USB4_LEPSM